MAWATKCDRCGKYFEYLTDETDGVALLDYDRRTDKYQTEEEYDLCPTCVKSFNDWFKRGTTRQIGRCCDEK